MIKSIIGGTIFGTINAVVAYFFGIEIGLAAIIASGLAILYF